MGIGAKEMTDEIEVRKTGYRPETGEIVTTLTGTEGFLIVPEDTPDLAFVDGIGDQFTQRVVNGEIVSKTSDVLEAQEVEEAWVELRNLRQLKLANSDWTQFPDTPANTEDWAAYRQELRDVPNNVTDPRTVVWPTPPSS